MLTTKSLLREERVTATWEKGVQKPYHKEGHQIDFNCDPDLTLIWVGFSGVCFEVGGRGEGGDYPQSKTC